MSIKQHKIVTRIYFLDVGMEKQQVQELGWRVSVLPIPAFHHREIYMLHVHSIQYNAGMGNTDTLHPILVFDVFPSLHLK